MVGTILPVVYGERNGRRGSNVHIFHAVGSIVGSAAVGAILGAVGSFALPLDPGRSTVVNAGLAGVVAGIYLWHELGVLSLPMPQVPRQVPAAWRFRFRPASFSFAYGLALGAGVFTHVWAASFYVVVVWTVVSANPLAGALVFSGFGIARAAPVLILGFRLRSIQEAFRLSWRVDEWSRVVHLVNGVLLGAAAGVLVSVAILEWPG